MRKRENGRSKGFLIIPCWIPEIIHAAKKSREPFQMDLVSLSICMKIFIPLRMT